MSFGLKRSVDPFYEEPLHKAFYHPSVSRKVSSKTKNFLSPDRSKNPGVDPKTKLTPEEEAFLRGSYVYEKPSKLPSNHHLVKGQSHEENSGKFDESWPGSERPSTMSPSYEDIRRATRGDDMSTIVSDGLSPVTALNGPRSKLDFTDVDNRKPDHGSTLSKYIERFRTGEPMSREERYQGKLANQRDFWWLGSAPSIATPPSSSTPKEGEEPGVGRGGAKSRTRSRLDRESANDDSSHTGSQLTRKNLVSAGLTAPDRNPWDMDQKSKILQDRADMLLERTSSSLHSTEPAVSTDGLGHSSADTTSLSDRTYRPTFTHVLDPSNFPRSRKPANKDEDILYQYRLRRRMEVARSKLPGGAPGGGLGAAPHKPITDEEIDSRLAEFRHKLITGGSSIEPAGGTTLHTPIYTPAPKVSQPLSQPHNQPLGQPLPIASPHRPQVAPSGGQQVAPHLHLVADILQPSQVMDHIHGNQQQNHGNQQDLGNQQSINQQFPANPNVASGAMRSENPLPDQGTSADSQIIHDRTGAKPPTNKHASELEPQHCTMAPPVCAGTNQPDVGSDPAQRRSVLASYDGPTDASFEAIKSQHLESLRSEDGSAAHSSEDCGKYLNDMVPEKDVGMNNVPKLRKTDRSPNRRSKLRKEKSMNKDSVDFSSSDSQSFTEVSDFEEQSMAKCRKDSRTHKHKPTGSIPSGSDQDSRRSSRSDRSKTRDRSRERSRGSSKGKTGASRRPTGNLPSPKDHSSPLRPVKDTIGQVIKDCLMSSSVASDSDLNEVTGAQDKGQRSSSHRSAGQRSSSKPRTSQGQSSSQGQGGRLAVSVGSRTESGDIRQVLIGEESITLSDGDEFTDDDLLADLRRRRQHFLQKLAQLDSENS